MPHTLIVCATTDAQTRRIAGRLQTTLATHGVESTLADIGQAPEFDLADFDCLVAGASVRYGRHDPRMTRFLDANRSRIERMANALIDSDEDDRTNAKPNKASDQATDET